MKKVILPAIAIIGLMAMSFTSATEEKFQVVKTETGQKLTNVHLLSIEDVKKIEAMTVEGAQETNLFHQSINLLEVDQTITKHTDPTDPKLPDELSQKLNNILAKY